MLLREYRVLLKNYKILNLELDFYKKEQFTGNNGPTEQGKAALKQCFNLGIFVLRDKLTVKTGFKLVTNADFRYQIYIFTLGSVERIIKKIKNIKSL